MTTKGKKHTGNAERCRIQFGLEAGESARTIAKEVGVSLSTVVREIAQHAYEFLQGDYRLEDLGVQCTRFRVRWKARFRNGTGPGGWT